MFSNCLWKLEYVIGYCVPPSNTIIIQDDSPPLVPLSKIEILSEIIFG